MKNCIIVFLVFISFTSKAQIEINIFSAPYLITTETNKLLPFAIELKPSIRWSLYVEAGIPFKQIQDQLFKGSTFNLRAQLRSYRQKLTKNKFRFYWAFEIYYLPQYYLRTNGAYLQYENNFKKIIPFTHADVGNVITSLSYKIGNRQAIKNRFIFDWNIGITLVQQSINYYNVSSSIPAARSSSSISQSGLFPLQSYFYNNDRTEGDFTKIAVSGSIRLGILIKRR